MALIKCPKCENSISDKAKICPSCGYKVKNVSQKKILLAILFLIILVGIVVGSIFGVKEYQRRKEEKRQKNIEQILKQSNNYYNQLDFENVTKCYDELDDLKYDTSEIRKILEYDESVYEAAENLSLAIKNVDEKLHSQSYSSLRSLMNTLKDPIEEFDDLKINKDSKIGCYISDMENNALYTNLKSLFVYNNSYDMDYYLTSSGYAYCIECFTEELVKVKFPYKTEE